LLALGALALGGTLATLPDANPWPALEVICFPFAIAAGFETGFFIGLLTILSAITAWVSFWVFYRFNQGKWSLFALFVSTFYIVLTTSHEFRYSISDDCVLGVNEGWWVPWVLMLLSPPLVLKLLLIPPVVGLVVGIPDFLNYRYRRAWRAEHPVGDLPLPATGEDTADSQPRA